MAHCKTCGKALKGKDISFFTPNPKGIKSKPYCDDVCVKWRYIPPEVLSDYNRRIFYHDFKGMY